VRRDGREYVAGVNSTIAAPLVAGTSQADCLRASAGVETTVDVFDNFIDDFITNQGLAVDACAPGNHDCDALGTCENTHGAFYCTDCVAGYDGDGTWCADIDECALDACDPLADCTNFPGGYSCGGCPLTHVDVNGDGTACVSEEVAAAMIDHTLVGSSCAAVTPPAWLVMLLLLRRRRR